MTSHPSLVLLNRHLTLKEPSPFTLVVDSLAQSAGPLISEYVYRSSAPVIYLSFETVSPPTYATAFYDCIGKNAEEIRDFVLSVSAPPKKSLVVVDSLNYVPVHKLSGFISTLLSPHHALIACYHSGVPVAGSTGPSSHQLLSFIAQSTFEVEPLLPAEEHEGLEQHMAQFRFPKGLNSACFKLNVTNKKKSGKSLSYVFTVDSEKHSYEIYQPKKEELDADDVMEGLTTFNLSTSSKQKLAREQVELPFMEAQAELGKYGGAIVYEFEKDDDYDEEDPYEDPF